jgi:bifunctional non-homologous end joining protein LigD
LSVFGDGSIGFGLPLDLSKVHWMRPEMVEVSYAELAKGRLLRQVVYPGEHGDKPATDLRRTPRG